jgi:hypothetical protein
LHRVWRLLLIAAPIQARLDLAFVVIQRQATWRRKAAESQMGEKPKDDKRERLAAELRANLKRRKDQARTRSRRAETGGASEAEPAGRDLEGRDRS